MGTDKNKFAEFQRIYIKQIAPYCKNIEQVRLKLLKKHIICISVFYAAVFICFIMYCFIFNFFSEPFNKTGGLDYLCPILMCLIFTPICVFFLAYIHSICKIYTHKYKMYLKEKILPKIAESFGIYRWECRDFKLKVELSKGYLDKLFKNADINEQVKMIDSLCSKVISKEELKYSGLFRDFPYIDIDDEFEGNYHDTTFKVSEMNTDRTFFSAGTNDFRLIPASNSGIILMFKRPKTTRYRTMVIPKGISSKKNEHRKYLLQIFYKTLMIFLLLIFISDIPGSFIYGGILIIFILISVSDDISLYADSKNKDKFLNKVTLEYEKFNKQFNTYSHDQTEARCLLTPGFIEQFYNLKKMFKGKKISCSFYDDKLMIAIYTRKDTFELGDIFKPITDSKNIAQFFKELNAIYNMIDILKIPN